MAKENNTKKELIKEEKNNRKEKKESKDIINKIDDNRKTIITGIVCFLLATLLFRCILWPDRIATLEDGTEPIVTIDGVNITADELYKDMKKTYPVDSLIRKADKVVLDKLYTDEEVKEDVNSTAQYYYSVYEAYYQMSKEDFLSNNGFKNEKEFLEYLTLDAKREKYFNEYIKSLITDKDIEKYYKENVTGDIDTKHILVNVSDDENGLTDTEAKKKAEEIIKKLNKGTKWEDIISEYKDYITDEELGYQAFNASLESSYLKEMKSLKVGKFSQKPVKTSYGYHIVYKIDEKEKPTIDDVRDEVIEAIMAEKKSKDSKLLDKTLIEMRKKYNITFEDTEFEKKYNDTIKSIK